MDDPFAELGLERRYELNRAALERAYLSRSLKAHPDVIGGEGADAAASRLNSARQVLLDPEKRAVALLSVLSREAGVQFSSADERALPDGFLMEMMEVREQMEADRVRGDAVLMKRWEAWAGEARMKHQENVGVLFARATDERGAVLKSIRLEINAWRYIERMIEQMDAPAV